ncbi:MAG: hypothetical protein RIS78_442 [Bacteroidota bacterium]|jgi:crossover junction endodeoxyribonuclease RuvC
MPQAPTARPTDKVILGIDPGTLLMGYGILRIQGNRVSLLDAGHWRFRSTDSHLLRLSLIFKQTLALIQLHQPDELAIEAPFFAQNVQSLIKLGRAQGAAIAAALERDIPVFEYLPKKIKQAVTGNGNASKQQVAAMLATLLQTPTDHFKNDATDALGAAYCHFLRMNDPTTTAVTSTTSRSTKTKAASGPKKKQAWEQFLRSNPDRQL